MLKFETKTNYMIASWSGARRAQDPRYINDPAFYLKQQIISLEKHAHKLSQITIAIAENPNEPTSYTQYLDEIPDYINGTKVVKFRRPNIGMSFGSLSDTFNKYEKEFDYYFFIEDDYVFSMDRFDKIILRPMWNNSRIGYVSGKIKQIAQQNHRWTLQAIGAFRTNALVKLRAINGTIWPFPNVENSNSYQDIEKYGQVGLSQGILTAGYEIADVGPHYEIGCRIRQNSVIWYNRGAPNRLIIPV